MREGAWLKDKPVFPLRCYSGWCTTMCPYHGPCHGGRSHGPCHGGRSHGPCHGGRSHGPCHGGRYHGPYHPSCASRAPLPRDPAPRPTLGPSHGCGCYCYAEHCAPSRHGDFAHLPLGPRPMHGVRRTGLARGCVARRSVQVKTIWTAAGCAASCARLGQLLLPLPHPLPAAVVVVALTAAAPTGPRLSLGRRGWCNLPARLCGVQVYGRYRHRHRHNRQQQRCWRHGVRPLADRLCFPAVSPP